MRVTERRDRSRAENFKTSESIRKRESAPVYRINSWEIYEADFSFANETNFKYLSPFFQSLKFNHIIIIKMIA